jgi:hypothetical protein
MLRIHNSALKRGYSRETISHVYDMALYDGMLDEDADPPKRLIIGFDAEGNLLLELMGGVVDNGDMLIWHAMKCRKQYLHLLPETGGER